MKSLGQLRVMQHEKILRQMVAKIHRGKLNVDQAAAKFEMAGLSTLTFVSNRR